MMLVAAAAAGVTLGVCSSLARPRLNSGEQVS